MAIRSSQVLRLALVFLLAGLAAPPARTWAQRSPESAGPETDRRTSTTAEEDEDFFSVVKGWFSHKREPELSVDEKYQEGMKRFYNHDFPGAIKSFERILDENPYSALAIQAELKVAECNYYNGKLEEALPLLDKFVKAHPANAEIPYATYLIGMCHYKRMDLIDRDQTQTEAAAATLRLLLDQFPDNVYAPLASKRLAECRERQAEHEMYIGRFYFKRGDYRAAAGRFQTVIDAYPEAKIHDEALYLLAVCLEKQKKWGEAEAKLEELLDTRPEGEYTAKAKESLIEVKKEAARAESEGQGEGAKGSAGTDPSKEAAPPTTGAAEDGEEEGGSWIPWF